MMKKYKVSKYLFLAICAIIPLQSFAYYGYPNERGSDQSNRNSNSSANQDDSNSYDRNNYQGQSRLQQGDYSKANRGNRLLAQNEADEDSHAYEIRHQDYRDIQYYNEHSGNQNQNQSNR